VFYALITQSKENIVSAVADKFVTEAQEALAKVEAEINSKVEPLVNEQKELKALIKKLTKGGGGNAKSAPSVAEEDLVAAVAHVAKDGPAKTVDIAKFLEVDSRTIARRLSALAQNAECAIEGNKDDGYTA
jgi:hypothetical protein